MYQRSVWPVGGTEAGQAGLTLLLLRGKGREVDMSLLGLDLKALQPSMIWRAVRVSLVVGAILNLINQGGALWSDTPVNWWHMALNFLVPFLVATYSAWAAESRRNAMHKGRHTGG